MNISKYLFIILTIFVMSCAVENKNLIDYQTRVIQPQEFRSLFSPFAFINGKDYTIVYEPNDQFKNFGRLYVNNKAIHNSPRLGMTSTFLLSYLEQEDSIIIANRLNAEVGCSTYFYIVYNDKMEELFTRNDCNAAPIFFDINDNLLNEQQMVDISNRYWSGEFSRFVWFAKDGNKYSQECFVAYRDYLRMRNISIAEDRKCEDIYVHEIIGELGEWDAIVSNKDFIQKICAKNSLIDIYYFCKNYPTVIYNKRTNAIL